VINNPSLPGPKRHVWGHPSEGPVQPTVEIIAAAAATCSSDTRAAWGLTNVRSLACRVDVFQVGSQFKRGHHTARTATLVPWATASAVFDVHLLYPPFSDGAAPAMASLVWMTGLQGRLHRQGPTFSRGADRMEWAKRLSPGSKSVSCPSSKSLRGLHCIDESQLPFALSSCTDISTLTRYGSRAHHGPSRSGVCGAALASATSSFYGQSPLRPLCHGQP
jgi:hypothetical protein